MNEMHKPVREEPRRDIPKTAAVIIYTVPGLAIRLGFNYLRMKKRSQRAAKRFVRNLQANGMPEAEAKRLGESYGTEISIRKLVSGRIPGLLENLRF